MPQGLPYFELRGLINSLYDIHRQEKGVMWTMSNMEGQAEIACITRGVRTDGWGRPVIEMVYADLRVKGELLPDSTLLNFPTVALSQYHKTLVSRVLFYYMENRPQRDVSIMRDLLKRNASLTKPSSWQRAR